MTQKLFFCNCNCKCKFLVHCIVCLPWWEKSSFGCDKVQCNVLVISILYNGEIEGLSVLFHVFYLNMMPFSMPRKLQKGLSFSPVSPNLGRVTRPQPPHFSALYTQNSTSAPLVPLPGTPFSHTPKHHLGYPISPFGMSHFTIWGIPFCHLGYFKACLCPHIGAVLPSLCADFFPL